MKLTIELDVADKIEAYQIVNKLSLRGFKVVSSELDKEKAVFNKDFKAKDFLNKKQK